MKTTYEPTLKAHVTRDDHNKVRHIRHSQEFWESEEDIPRVSAERYLKEFAAIYRIPPEQLQNLHAKVSFYDPREQDVEYRLAEEKHLFDSTTVGYYQTYLNTPVWRKGLTVKVKQNPNRVIASTSSSEGELEGALPDRKAIDKYKALIRQVAIRQVALDPALGEIKEARNDKAAHFVRRVTGVRAPRRAKRNAARAKDETRVLSAKFFIYTYDPERRYAGKGSPQAPPSKQVSGEVQIPVPTLPRVSRKIKAAGSYLVAEIVFTSNLGGFAGVSWLMLVEVESDSILYIECMTAGVNGKVFKRDPIVKTGVLAITSAKSNADLNPYRDDVVLTNLDAPVAGVQHLRGTWVDVEELAVSHADPDVAVPTKLAGVNFDYNARTNDFGAVSAYYHQTELFKTIESLGFPIATYLDGTTFPIPIDHRALGDVINAHCVGNTTGTLHQCYALVDTTGADPLCRCVDPWVHWHEMGGHGLLFDHVGSASLGFSHSAGDGLAALQMDPESQLRGLPERFKYAPFRPNLDRRFDRPGATWNWGGANDDGDYGSEEILATCHFRIYRSIGGDAASVHERRFASRAATYLILRTIGALTPVSNPDDAELWCAAMQDADHENWDSEGLVGGAYNKVVRWAFEKQGSYGGNPPEVDVYIDDGRGGEYQYIYNHWSNQSMWNRNASDGMVGHQNAIETQTNYMYAKVKNRGTLTANNVTVRAYHSKPGAGLTWPDDFVEMSPIGGLTIANIPADSAGAVQVGPFAWQPNVNALGHDCVLMIASVAGDASNVDNFTPSESIQEWRLVPNDNNVGQRNVWLVPGGGGMEALMAALDGAFFMAGNNLNRRAYMQLEVEMPKVLTERGWLLEFEPNNAFSLKAGEKREVRIRVKKGSNFSKADIEATTDRMINVVLTANDITLGGMSYEVDPNLT